MGGMTSDIFNSCSFQQKTELVLQGTFLADRLTDRYYIKLYNLHQFYVEVFFDDHTHLIVHFRAFENTMFVLPYVSDLKIAV